MKEFAKKLMPFFKDNMTLAFTPSACLLALAPLFGASHALLPGIFCGICFLFILTATGTVISLVGRWIPSGIKLAAYMVICAFFTTLCELLLSAFLPEIFSAIGIYLPLISLCGAAFSNAERADGESVKNAANAGFTTGISFLTASVVLSFFRELLGSGTLFGLRIIPEEYAVRALTSPFGAFVLFGVLAVLVTLIPKDKKTEEEPEPGKEEEEDAQ